MQNPQIFEILHKNWLKFLSYTHNFGVLHLKLAKILKLYS